MSGESVEKDTTISGSWGLSESAETFNALPGDPFAEPTHPALIRLLLHFSLIFLFERGTTSQQNNTSLFVMGDP